MKRRRERQTMQTMVKQLVFELHSQREISENAIDFFLRPFFGNLVDRKNWAHFSVFISILMRVSLWQKESEATGYNSITKFFC